MQQDFITHCDDKCGTDTCGGLEHCVLTTKKIHELLED